jgi:hypothetical protein
MKKATFLIVLFASCLTAIHAQQINYESSLEIARTKSLRQQKPLAILITIDIPIPEANVMTGLSNKTVVQRFNDNFINYKVA